MENDDLISRSALMRYINDTHPYAGLPMAAHVCTMELLTYAPTVEARPVVHGRWVKKAHYPYYCSVCEMIAPLDFEGESHYKSNYCPNCGAKMEANK